MVRDKRLLMSASPSERTLSRAQLRRRADIVEAALTVFDRQGFEAARMEDVAAEAEIAKGTVYLYFKNKQALLEGVIQAVVKPAVNAVEQAAADHSQTAAQRLVRQIEVIGDRLGRGQMKTVLRLMIAEGPRHDDLRRFYYQQVVRPGMDAIRRCLADGEASGEFRPGSAKLHPQVFAGVPLMAAIWRMLFDDLEPLEIERLLRDHLDTVLKGLESK